MNRSKKSRTVFTRTARTRGRIAPALYISLTVLFASSAIAQEQATPKKTGDKLSVTGLRNASNARWIQAEKVKIEGVQPIGQPEKPQVVKRLGKAAGNAEENPGKKDHRNTPGKLGSGKPGNGQGAKAKL